ncbi:MAG: ABC-F family ATP-binding cassette domain-containing protein [Chlamydiota bacterium]
MTLFLNGQNISKSFGTQVLFENLSFGITEHERIGLIGPNGSGKSTLLKILMGQESPDKGTISMKKGLRVGYVPQSSVFPDISAEKVLENVLPKNMPDYEKEVLVQTWLSKLGFIGNEPSAMHLSGGWKKRLSFAKELILEPDLVLLDEPTNHLDLEGILWLEKFLKKEAVSYLLVSHDRYFLQNMVDRVIEINKVYPEGLMSLKGSYAHFLEKKEEFLAGQLQQQQAVASKARKEQAWLRESPKARTTKAQSRIDGAHEVLGNLAAIKERNRLKKTDIDFTATNRETRKLLVAKNISKGFGDKFLFKDLDFTLSPGTRMGLMGPNGSGKTTLLRMLKGEVEPDMGTLKRADVLKVVYFDQHRSQLPDNITLRQALSPDGDFVNYNGQMIHVNGWCRRFLFSPDSLEMPVGVLSGGEKARISIAHLMLQPADLLLLDEPTNDLDIPTLETLEESLMDFPGAVVLITHDRAMLDRVCNVFLGFGDPENHELYADYQQWQRAQKQGSKQKVKKEEPKPSNPPPAKLSYADKKECDQIESQIAALEKEVQKKNQELALVGDNTVKLQEICKEIGLLENQIEQLYLRFSAIEQKREGKV